MVWMAGFGLRVGGCCVGDLTMLVAVVCVFG